MKWLWDNELQMQVCGDEKEGCGVFIQDDRRWAGNVVYHQQMMMINNCETEIEAKQKCEAQLEEYRKEFND